ncbi:MAG: hypothetical protein EB006_13540, partial [Betaproteobacteria bacterium]|nr:hypothetical protein [Betaproteobacteria bacterium]
YDGTGKAYTATASGVSGFSYSYSGRNSTTYGPSDEPPVNAGDYTVTATSTDSIYTGSAQQDFTITQATATVSVSDLIQVYNGSPRPVTVTTVPANLAVSVQYNGGTTVPTNVGSYPVQATVTDANHTGSKSEVLTIVKADLLLSSLPTASAITYGQTLADSTLSGGQAKLGTDIVAGSFAFTTPTTAPNAGTGSQGVTFSPTDTTNYNPVTTTVSVTVNTKPLTITGISGKDKVYNGNRTADINGLAALAGKIGSDDVALTGALNYQFADPNVGNDKGITVSGGALSGATAPNYSLSYPTDLKANVTAKNLTITGISIADKEFDGATTATINGTASYVGLQGTDNFAVAGTPTAAFLTPDVGTNKQVTVSGFTAPSANYTVTQPSGLTANITAASSSMGGAAAISYNPAVSASLRTDGPWNLGTKIRIGSSPVVVASLGAQDGGNWLANAIRVGLWSGDGATLIAQTTVSSTNVAEAGGYRYASITPITLSANTEYIIGALGGTGYAKFYDGNNSTLPYTSGSTNIIIVVSTYNDAASGFSAPTWLAGGGVGGVRWAFANFKVATDTDGDGLSDSAELAAGTDPGKADTDGDGLTDGQESTLGSNPNNALSMPKT